MRENLVQSPPLAVPLCKPPHGRRPQVVAEELLDSVGLEQPCDAKPGGPQADDTDSERVQRRTGLLRGIEKRREHHDGGCVLVIV